MDDLAGDPAVVAHVEDVQRVELGAGALRGRGIDDDVADQPEADDRVLKDAYLIRDPVERNDLDLGERAEHAAVARLDRRLAVVTQAAAGNLEHDAVGVQAHDRCRVERLVLDMLLRDDEVAGDLVSGHGSIQKDTRSVFI